MRNVYQSGIIYKSGITALLLLVPVFAEAAVIQYQDIGLTYIVATSASNSDTGDGNTNNANVSLTSDPQDIVLSSAFGGASSTAELNFDLDQAANSFTFDVSAAVDSDLAANDLGLLSVAVRLFIEFTVESSESELVELIFSVENVISGLDVPDQANVNSGFLGSLPAGQFTAPFVQNATTDSTLLLRTGETYTILAELDIFAGSSAGATRFLDGRSIVTTSLAVQDVPEPPLLGAISIAFLLLTRRRLSRKSKAA